MQSATPSLPSNSRRAPVRLVYACTAILILILLATNAAVILLHRGNELLDEEGQLALLSLTVAEHADRSLLPINLVISSVVDGTAGSTIDAADFVQRMTGNDVHLLLVNKISSVPQLAAISVFSREGKLINTSRVWPIPEVDVSDRDYFRALKADSSLKNYIGAPEMNRVNGTWTIVLAQRINGTDGELSGVIIGAINMRYFEDFYQAISLDDGISIALQRVNGEMLARFPQSDAIGKVFSSSEHLLRGGVSGTVHETSPIDGRMRIKAARLLPNYPLIALVTKTEEAALAEWRYIARLIAFVALGSAIAIAIAGFAIGRLWRQHAAFSNAQTDLRLQRERIATAEATQAALRQNRDDLEREVTERTADLVASEARLTDAIETIPEGFVLFDAEDRLVVCNAAYRALSKATEQYAKPGITFEELLTRVTIEQGRHSVDGPLADDLQMRIAQHRAVGRLPVRTEIRAADGRWIEVHERRTRDGGIVGLRIDVTEARRRDAVSAERSKLSALGQLAGGVAHEINNLLQPALTFTDLMLLRLPPEDVETREDLELVLSSVRKAREIVRNILLFSRKEEVALETVDFAVETDTALKFIRDVLPPGISLAPHFRFTGVMAAVNKTQLTQVLTNLVLNAAHASGNRGTIEVTVGQARPTAGEAEALGIEAGAAYLTLAVADHGTGIDAATLAHIFEPFFTTKPVGEGTGLGLSVVFGILRSWKGAIAVDSVLGSGTVFTLYIPIADSAQIAA